MSKNQSCTEYTSMPKSNNRKYYITPINELKLQRKIMKYLRWRDTSAKCIDAAETVYSEALIALKNKYNVI